jgi:hypothetical protein
VKRLAALIYESFPVQLVVTLVTYCLFAALIGTCLFPSVIFLRAMARALLAASSPSMGLGLRLFLFSLCIAGSLYLYFITGILILGCLIRLLSLGIRPGRYAMLSGTTVRWLIYSGIYVIALKTVLPLLPVSFFPNLFFRLVGCRMGRGVRLNSWSLNDAYMIEIGDNVTIGGNTDLTPHQWEDNHLILEPIRIGGGTLIGAHCYITSGVTIGKNCLIGIGSFIRRGRRIADNTRTTSLGALSLHEMYGLERSARREAVKSTRRRAPVSRRKSHDT